jgi:5-formyltetrahydrofolate cyclo-ligase
MIGSVEIEYTARRGTFMFTKSEARKHFESIRRALSVAQVEQLGAASQAHVLQSEFFARAQCIAVYAAQAFEGPTSALCAAARQHKKRTVFPKINADSLQFFVVDTAATQLVSGARGLLEPSPACKPVALDEIDLFIVPLVAFTLGGHRLGRGGGFYDRVLSQTSATTVGLSFEACRAETLPTEPHDIRLDAIATEKMLYRATLR